MKIITDTREQKPLRFKHDQITEVLVSKLDIGDYAVQFEDGHRPSVFFERKTIPDLFGTMTRGYKRFKKEIVRAQESGSTLIIVVEGSISEILAGHTHSTVEGISILRKLFTLWIRHGIQFHCFSSRKEMSKYIAEFYYSLGKEYIRRKKTL